jgi:hypothetical protein
MATLRSNKKLFSHFDNLHRYSRSIERRMWHYRLIPVIAVVSGSVAIAASFCGPIVAFAVLLVTLLASRAVADTFLTQISDGFAELGRALERTKNEKAQIRQKTTDLIARFPTRRKSEQFKVAYFLKNKPIADLEASLALGMYKEGKEVWVTAFVKNGIAVRVTASIGSASSCHAKDDPQQWAHHFLRLGCDELRQYHNHPTTSNETEPSPTDFRTVGVLKRMLLQHGIAIKAFIFYWNQIGEWRLLQYDDSGYQSVHTVFDVTE